MLKSLFIRNFVLIDQLDIRFENGFSVITGETGAGKSIILGALALALGQRADVKSIKNGSDKCVIEISFDISAYELETFFQEKELEYDPLCIIRRELYSSGKSRAFVNDSPVSLSVLKELGGQLIDIHSQHQNLLLGDDRFQLRVVDVMAGNSSLLDAYHSDFIRYQQQKHALKTLQAKAGRIKEEEDYNRFQLQQLQESRLEEGEQDALERELEMLSHAEEIKSGLYKINRLLEGEEQSIVSALKESLATAENVRRYYPEMEMFVERLRSAYLDLNDLSSETETMQEDVEFDPNRLEWVNERLHTLYSLEQKHRVSTVAELMEIQSDYEKKLQEIDSFDEQITDLKKEIDFLRNDLLRQAAIIREQRKVASRQIVAKLEQMLAPLGMPHIRFAVHFIEKPEPEESGIDEVQFLFSANKNRELQPVAEIASGGEISRLMLCIKAMIAGIVALPAIVFDEIDTGVSGDIADKMGDIMQDLGANMQVLTITHLPQIAAKGKAHYFVYKQDMPDQTVTCIKQLNREERLTEIARMLSGSSLTDAAIANAKELLTTNGF